MSRALVYLSLFVFLARLSGQDAPKVFTVPASTLSPDGRYGVTVPVLAAFDDATASGQSDELANNLVEVQTGRTLVTIQGRTGWDRMNRGGVLPARWSPDGTLLLWEVEGRFSPDTLTLLKLVDGKIIWQVDLLQSVQQASLTRTRQAAPKQYAAAKHWTKGNGSAFPDGFAVNVRVEGDKARSAEGDVKGKPIALPMRVHAELTSNPKQIEGCPTQLDARLDGVIDRQGKLTVSRFQLRRKLFANATEDSWLALTDPPAAVHPPLDYGDVVFLQGRVTVRQEGPDKNAYFLTLDRKVSVPATADKAAAHNVSEVRLLGFEMAGLPVPGVATMGTCNVDGTLGHAPVGAIGPPVTLTVRDYGY